MNFKSWIFTIFTHAWLVSHRYRYSRWNRNNYSVKWLFVIWNFTPARKTPLVVYIFRSSLFVLVYFMGNGFPTQNRCGKKVKALTMIGITTFRFICIIMKLCGNKQLKAWTDTLNIILRWKMKMQHNGKKWIVPNRWKVFLFRFLVGSNKTGLFSELWHWKRDDIKLNVMRVSRQRKTERKTHIVHLYIWWRQRHMK